MKANSTLSSRTACTVQSRWGSSSFSNLRASRNNTLFSVAGVRLSCTSAQHRAFSNKSLSSTTKRNHSNKSGDSERQRTLTKRQRAAPLRAPDEATSSDRALRLQRLQDALDRLAEFRRWCATQRHPTASSNVSVNTRRGGGGDDGEWARAAGQRSTAAATTLADVCHTAHKSPSSLLSANAMQPHGDATTSSSPSVTLMERRLLAHLASLLNDVRQAAVRVPTADFLHRHYDAAVAAALAPPPPQAQQKRQGSNVLWHGPFSIPRSRMWTDATTAARHAGPVALQRGKAEKAEEGMEEGVVAAEKRLAHWAAQWHAEVLQHHHPPRKAGGSDEPLAFGSDGDADGPVERHGVVDENGETEEQDGAENASYAPLLIRGEWRRALALLLHATHTPSSSASSRSSSVGQEAEASAVEALFSPAALRHRYRAWLRPSLQENQQSSGEKKKLGSFSRLPQQLALAPVTEAELRLLVSPPSPGLRVLWPRSTNPASSDSLSSAHAEDAMTGEEKEEEERSLTVLAEAEVRAVAAREVAEGRTRGAPPSCVVQLRRRLWALQHLPRSLPPSLVRFAEPFDVNASPTTAAARRRGGSAVHPYLERCEALEKLPWYPLCVLGHVLEAAGDGDMRTETETCRLLLLQRARRQLHHSLFLHTAPDYASVMDYVHLLFVTVGSSMTARQVRSLLSPQRKTITTGGSGGGSEDKVEDERRMSAVVMRVEGAFAETAMALLRPPTQAEYDAACCPPAATAPALAPAHLTGKETTFTWEQLIGSVEDAPNSSLRAPSSVFASEAASVGVELPPLPEVTSVRRVSAEVFDVLCRRTQSRFNYHLSLYCETLSQVGDGAGVALRELSRVLNGFREEHSTSGEEAEKEKDANVHERTCEVVPVLAPESAAAITTAILLQHLAHGSPSQLLSTLPAILFFAVPHDKAHAVASYFKGIYHPHFFQRVCGPAAATANVKVSDSASVEEGVSCGPSLVLPAQAWHSSAAAQLVGRSLRRVDRYPTSATEAFFARYIRGEEAKSSHRNVTNESADSRGRSGKQTETQRISDAAAMAPPLALDVYSVDINAAVAHWRAVKKGGEKVEVEGEEKHNNIEKTSMTRCDEALRRSPMTSVTDASAHVVAGPPQLPYGLYALFKPAHATCTLHAHYPTLIFSLLSRQLPWRGVALQSSNPLAKQHGAAEAKTRIGEAGEGDAAVVPVLHQQGLVNRIDVGTSGVVLVTRDAAALHCATDAMTREHRMVKTYRALVQRWPPLPSSSSSSAATPRPPPMFSTDPFLSSQSAAVICAPVYAAGGTSSAVQRPASNLPAPQQKYSRPHAALHDRRAAVTRYRVLEWFASVGVAYVEVELDSGRRHQIRQHFAQLGFPLIGDGRYHPEMGAGKAGKAASFGLERAALHAYAIRIFAPPQEVNAEVGCVVVQVPLPPDMHQALQKLRALEKRSETRLAQRYTKTS